ncbi:SET and MYND domain-containing protein DDB_G0273589-like isoform X2 [Sitodiplosis mosellana]|uniref:SET and MYND domain-containing protein DDB_G0273589-like isoform X2 n=1 Tax=Sitodiplosis mosellana TaxID=263140 RepID=UPI0024441B1E|nr:SET and MYND domain-containing protein DDB_G0273589-like isoform X2 [Sitodiplosis mosellana]
MAEQDRIWVTVQGGEHDEHDEYVDLFDSAEVFNRQLLKWTIRQAFQFKIKKNQRRSVLGQVVSRELEPNQRFVGLAQSVSFHSSADFGRHLIANVEIPFETKVAESRAYAAVIDHTTNGYCVTCLGEIPSREESQDTGVFSQKCTACNIVKYCSDDCVRNNTTHVYECGSAYHAIIFGTEIIMKLAIQLVFKALALHAGNIRRLRNVVARILADMNNNNAVHMATIRDEAQRFECIMRLTAKRFYPEFHRQVYETYATIMQIPSIAERFEGQSDKRFLQHLIGHFLRIASNNSFENELISNVYICTLYDTISFFNHSCAPNVTICMEGGTMHCIACREIKANEQLFIDYCEFETETRAVRRRKLRESWNINCVCERCENSPITRAQIDEAKSKNLNQLQTFLRDKNQWTQEIGAYIIAYKNEISKLL